MRLNNDINIKMSGNGAVMCPRSVFPQTSGPGETARLRGEGEQVSVGARSSLHMSALMAPRSPMQRRVGIHVRLNVRCIAKILISTKILTGL